MKAFSRNSLAYCVPEVKETVNLELVARQAGELTIQAAAVGDADLAVETEKKVMIRQAKLQIAVNGPKRLFAGQEAVYRIDLSNVGDAPAGSLVGAVDLPTGGEYLGGLEGAQVDGGRVAWNVAGLNPWRSANLSGPHDVAAAGRSERHRADH